jgi:hypothetical protein
LTRVVWDDYRKCSICGVAIGKACRARSGRIVDGQPDGMEIELEVPHVGRKRRTGRRWPLAERAESLEGRPHPIR